MPVSVIQAIKSEISSGTTPSATWGSATVARNHLLALVTHNNGRNVTGTPAGWIFRDSNNATENTIAWALYEIPYAASRSGAEVFNVSLTGDMAVYLFELSGLDEFPALDVVSKGSGGATIPAVSATSSATAGFALAVAAEAGGPPLPPGNVTESGWTNMASGVRSQVSYRTGALASSFTATWTNPSTASTWNAAVITFNADQGTRTTPRPATLTHGTDTTDQAAYTTATVLPGANRLMLLSFMTGTGSGDSTDPTVTGCGLTWVKVGASNVSTTRRAFLYRAMGSTPRAGSITITFGSNRTVAVWSLTEVTGVNTSGLNGSGAVNTSTTFGTAGAATTGSVTMPTPLTDSITFASVYQGNSQQVATPGGTGWTKIMERFGGTPSITHMNMWKVGGDTSVSASWAGTTNWGFNVVEVRASTQTTQPVVVQALSTEVASGTSVSLALNSTPDQGNLLVAVLGNSGTLTSPTLPFGLTTPDVVTPGTNPLVRVFSKTAVAGESNTVTVSHTGSAGALVLSVYEVLPSGGRAWLGFDKSAVVADVTGTGFTSIAVGPTATQAEADDFACAGMVCNSTIGTTFSWSNSYLTAPGNTNGSRGFSGYKVLSSTAAESTTATWTTSRGFPAAALITYKQTLGGSMFIKSSEVAALKMGTATPSAIYFGTAKVWP